MTRSQMMAGIKSKDTKPEIAVRRVLHSKGFRFRLHDRSLPGHPDLVLRKYGAVIFVNGCFWHAHGCSYFKLPSTNQEFWKDKLGLNQKRDAQSIARLRSKDWRILTVWECAVRQRSTVDLGNAIAEWLTSDDQVGDIAQLE